MPRKCDRNLLGTDTQGGIMMIIVVKVVQCIGTSVNIDVD